MSLCRKVAVLAIGLVLLGTAAFAVYLLQVRREPRHEGKSLSQWTDEYRRAKSPASRKAIGTNAVPDLLRDLSADRPDLPEQIQTVWRSKSPLVLMAGPSGRHAMPADRLDRHRRARAGFQALGANAAAAVPELIALLPEREAGWRAAQSLASIGEPAVAPVLELVSSTNAIIQYNALYALRLMPPSDEIFYALLATKDPESSLPDPAVLRILCTYTNRPHTLVSLLIEYLGHPSESVRGQAARELGKLGAAAEPALPHLLRLMPNEPNPDIVPRAISYAIGAINASLTRQSSELDPTSG